MESLGALLGIIDGEWSNLKILYAEPWSIPWTIPPGERDDYEIHLLESGSGCFTIGDRPYDVGPGDVMLLHSMRGNGFRSGGEFRLVFITFGFDNPKNPESIAGFNRMLQAENLPLKIGENSGVRGLFYRMQREIASHAAGHEIRMKLHLGALVTEIQNACETVRREGPQTVSSHLNKRINEIILYLQENANTGIDLEKMGKAMNLHPGYICTIFRQSTGSTISEFVRRLRIDKAKRLLLYTTLSITEIAFEAGFNNSQYFSKVFRRMEGMDPRSYRKARKSLQ